ncbi:MAG: hypothetical protein GTO02_13705 [Candidatus Dadabacteria bacterium]|nr:hypothetical protein [Candidatus Dadabacteria bacterium]
MSKTIVVKCNCKNEWMDKTYGNNMRPANALLKEGYYRCTNCTTVHSYTESRKGK